jgi:hypothetical protein
MIRATIVCACAALLAGCAANDLLPVDAAQQTVVQRPALAQVDLSLALDPQDYGKSSVVLEDRPGFFAVHTENFFGSLSVVNPFRSKAQELQDEASSEEAKNERIRLEKAFNGFYDPQYRTYGTAEQRRTRVVGQLVAASNTNCGIFLQTLHGVQGTTNFVLGSVATATAGAGSIVTARDGARILAGVASIISGVRAEANEDYYRNVLSDVLEKAIDSNRSDTLKALDDRAGDPITTFPVEEAVALAITYNDQCSLVAGLSKITTSVALSDDPAGLRAFRNVFAKAGYSPKINITGLTDTGLATVAGKGPMQAMAAMAQATVKGDIARLQAHANSAKAQIKAVDPTASTDPIDKLVAQFQAPGSGAIATVMKQIDDLKTQYDALAASLASANSDDQDKIDRLLRANDYAAAQAFAVFEDCISKSSDGIDDAVAIAVKPKAK